MTAADGIRQAAGTPFHTMPAVGDERITPGDKARIDELARMAADMPFEEKLGFTAYGVGAELRTLASRYEYPDGVFLAMRYHADVLLLEYSGAYDDGDVGTSR